jgi:hypothetical protein
MDYDSQFRPVLLVLGAMHDLADLGFLRPGDDLLTPSGMAEYDQVKAMDITVTDGQMVEILGQFVEAEEAEPVRDLVRHYLDDRLADWAVNYLRDR